MEAGNGEPGSGPPLPRDGQGQDHRSHGSGPAGSGTGTSDDGGAVFKGWMQRGAGAIKKVRGKGIFRSWEYEIFLDTDGAGAPGDRAAQTTMLEAALEERCDLLVLDEACGACRTGLVDESVLKKAVLSRPAGCEVVLTGREPAPWMQEAADYITRMEGERHPFERGIRARKGVEF